MINQNHPKTNEDPDPAMTGRGHFGLNQPTQDKPEVHDANGKVKDNLYEDNVKIASSSSSSSGNFKEQDRRDTLGELADRREGVKDAAGGSGAIEITDLHEEENEIETITLNQSPSDEQPQSESERFGRPVNEVLRSRGIIDDLQPDSSASQVDVQTITFIGKRSHQILLIGGNLYIIDEEAFEPSEQVPEALDGEDNALVPVNTGKSKNQNAFVKQISVEELKQIELTASSPKTKALLRELIDQKIHAPMPFYDVIPRFDEQDFQRDTPIQTDDSEKEPRNDQDKPEEPATKPEEPESEETTDPSPAEEPPLDEPPYDELPADLPFDSREANEQLVLPSPETTEAIQNLVGNSTSSSFGIIPSLGDIGCSAFTPNFNPFSSYEEWATVNPVLSSILTWTVIFGFGILVGQWRTQQERIKNEKLAEEVNKIEQPEIEQPEKVEVAKPDNALNEPASPTVSLAGRKNLNPSHLKKILNEKGIQLDNSDARSIRSFCNNLSHQQPNRKPIRKTIRQRPNDKSKLKNQILECLSAQGDAVSSEGSMKPKVRQPYHPKQVIDIDQPFKEVKEERHTRRRNERGLPARERLYSHDPYVEKYLKGMKMEDQESESSKQNSDNYPDRANTRRGADSVQMGRTSNSNSMTKSSKIFGYSQNTKLENAQGSFASEDRVIGSQMRSEGTSDIIPGLEGKKVIDLDPSQVEEVDDNNLDMIPPPSFLKQNEPLPMGMKSSRPVINTGGSQFQQETAFGPEQRESFDEKEEGLFIPQATIFEDPSESIQTPNRQESAMYMDDPKSSIATQLAKAIGGTLGRYEGVPVAKEGFFVGKNLDTKKAASNPTEPQSEEKDESPILPIACLDEECPKTPTDCKQWQLQVYKPSLLSQFELKNPHKQMALQQQASSGEGCTPCICPSEEPDLSTPCIEYGDYGEIDATPKKVKKYNSQGAFIDRRNKGLDPSQTQQLAQVMQRATHIGYQLQDQGDHYHFSLNAQVPKSPEKAQQMFQQKGILVGESDPLPSLFTRQLSITEAGEQHKDLKHAPVVPTIPSQHSQEEDSQQSQPKSNEQISKLELSESSMPVVDEAKQQQPRTLAEVMKKHSSSDQSSATESVEILNLNEGSQSIDEAPNSESKEAAADETVTEDEEAKEARKIKELKEQKEQEELEKLRALMDNGRFIQKFKDVEQIGQGGFGKVYKATYRVDLKQYAIKVVRLHIEKGTEKGASQEIYDNRVFRELKATSNITSENTVRYYSSWFEELSPEEQDCEIKYRTNYNLKLEKRKDRRMRRLQEKKQKLKNSVYSGKKIRKEMMQHANQKFSKRRACPDVSKNQQKLTQSILKQGRKRVILEVEEDEESISSYKEESKKMESIRESDNSIEMSRGTHYSSQENGQNKKQAKARSPETSMRDSESLNGDISDQDSLSRISRSLVKKPQTRADIASSSSEEESSSSEESSESSSSSSNDSSSQNSSSASSSSCVSSSVASSSQVSSSVASSCGASSSIMQSQTGSSEASSSMIQPSVKTSKHSKMAKTLRNPGKSGKSLKSQKSKKIKKDHSERKSSKRSSLDRKRLAEVLLSNKNTESEDPSSAYFYDTSSSEEEDDDSFSLEDQFSQITLNEFLKKKIDCISVNMMIQMEYCSGQSLAEYLLLRNAKGSAALKEDGGIIDRAENIEIFTQMVNGLAEIHKNKVVHRDLKPENIFIDTNDKSKFATAKIGDFGLARMLVQFDGAASNQSQRDANSEFSTDSSKLQVPEAKPILFRKASSSSSEKKSMKESSTQSTLSHFSSVGGTQIYMAPETKKHYFKGTKPVKFSNIETNLREDMYQVGLILYELCHPISTNSEKMMLFKQLQDKRQLSPRCCVLPNVHIEYDLIMMLTENDPTKRPSARTILNEYVPLWKAQIEGSKTPALLPKHSEPMPRTSELSMKTQLEPHTAKQQTELPPFESVMEEASPFSKANVSEAQANGSEPIKVKKVEPGSSGACKEVEGHLEEEKEIEEAFASRKTVIAKVEQKLIRELRETATGNQ